MKNIDIISRIRSTHKLLSADASINDRTILAIAKGKAVSLVRRESQLRRLWSTDTLFTTVDCLEMEEHPIAECCSFSSNVMVARSKHQLPTISEGIFNYLIKGVYAVDLSREVKYTSINRYINLLKLKLPTDVYYWIHNKYLYVSSPLVKTVAISAFFEEELSQELLFPECDCHSKKKKDSCSNPLDEEFKCPNYLIDGSSGANGVIALVSNELLSTYFNVSTDKTSDNNDQQSK